MRERSVEIKSNERRTFEHYLRTGRMLVEEQSAGEGVKFNPWHDPDNGQFTFAPGGPGSLANAVHVPRSKRGESISVRIPPTLPANGKRLPDGGVSVRIPLPADASYEEVVAEKVKAGATRIWPVAGDGRPAERGEIGPNGLPYSDGRFSLTGAYRTGRDRKPKRHMGIDLPAPIGAPVLAAAGGVVKHWDEAGGYGKIVVVQHEDGTRALYAHLSERLVRNGETVRIGQPIGRVGLDGNAVGRGSHLHFEITDARFNPLEPEAKMDPVEWMKRGTSR